MYILIAEDEVDLLDCYIESLEAAGHRVRGCLDGQEALFYFLRSKVDYIITDIDMPIKNGLELIKEVRLVDTEIPILVISGSLKYNETDLIKLGATKFVPKTDFLVSIIKDNFKTG